MTDWDRLPMRAGLGQFRDATDEQLTFIKQCGVDDFLMNTPNLPGDERWEFRDLLMLRTKAESFGLRLVALENTPRGFYDRIMLGLDGREEQLENMKATLRNMGKADIPVLGYNWMPNGVWRTSRDTRVRGGARATSFKLELAKDAPNSHERVYTADELWDNYCWYFERILPVAEEAGVKLALHPDDPPVDYALGGVARICSSFAHFKRAMDTFDSPYHGLDFCHGCWSEMKGGKGVLEAIDYFASTGKIIYVHFRDVQGSVNDFVEVWANEGNDDMLDVVRRLKQHGFNGIMIPDHVPHMDGDTPWAHRGRAWTVGYITALVEAVNKLDPDGVGANGKGKAQAAKSSRSTKSKAKTRRAKAK